MRILCCILFLLGNLLCSSIAATGKPVNALTLKVLDVQRSGTVTVELGNSSNIAVRIWKESNSWGAARWRVLRIRKGQLETFFQNPDRGFTKNNPSFTEIAGGGHIQQKLDLNEGNWCGLGHCGAYNEKGFGSEKMSFEPNDTVVVIYDAPRTNESGKMGVWYGVAAAFTTVQ
jgi:hypothetical protein